MLFWKRHTGHMDAQWLKAQFKLNPDKKQADLARTLELTPPAISKILAGQRQIKAKEYVLMRKFFGLPADGQKAAEPRGSAYALGTLENGTAMQDRASETDETQWIMPASVFESRTQTAPENIKIFKVAENAMSPDFTAGEQVLVDLSDQKPSPPGAFIVSDGMGYIIRRCDLIPHSDPPDIKISANDSNIEPYTASLEKTHIIGRVIAKLQWL